MYGNSDPVKAIGMLDSIRDEVASSSEYVRMKYLLLDMRLRDKAYIIPQSDSIAKIVLSYFEKNGNGNDLQETYYYVGSTYRDLDDIPRALRYFHQASDWTEKSDVIDSIMLRNTYSNLTVLFYGVQDYHNALSFALKEYRIACELNVVDIKTLTHVGEAYLHLDSVAKANDFFVLSIEHADTTSGVDMFPLLYDLSFVQNKSKASYCYDLIMRNRIIPHGHNYGALAEYHYMNKDIDSTIINYQKLLSEEEDIGKQRNAVKNLLLLAIQMGKVHETSHYAEKFVQICDSLDLGGRQELAATANNRYKYYRNAEAERRLHERNARYRRWAIAIVAIAVVIILSIIIFYLYKKNRYYMEIMKLTHDVSALDHERIRLKEQAKLLESEMHDANIKLQNTKLELAKVSNDLGLTEIELKIKEKMLSEKMDENKRVITLLHKAEIEEHAEDIVAIIRKASVGHTSISPDQWQRFYHEVDNLQPDLMENIIHNLGKFTDQQKQVCYLMSVGFNNSQIENITGLPHVTVWRWTKRFSWISSPK